MLHHKKNFDTHKVLASTNISNCKGLSEAKGFITDGEEELFHAYNVENKTSKSHPLEVHPAFPKQL